MANKLKLLLHASSEIAKERNLNSILLKLADVTRSLLSADRCSIFLHDKKNKQLWTMVAHGGSQIRVPDHAGIVGYVCQSGEVLNITDAYKDSRFNKDVDKKTGYRTHTILAFPLTNMEDESIGVFQVINKLADKHFNKGDIELLQHLSLYVASNLENAMLHDKIKAAHQDVVYRLSHATKFKDPETQNHIVRVGLFAAEISRYLEWSEEEQEIIKLAAPMHDIGKVGIPDNILQKPGKLDGEEWSIMQKHTLYGYEVLKGGDSRLLQVAALAARDHHEKWNGLGYPEGKKGKDISIYGRLTAIADVFDALTSTRCYKTAWPYEKALGLIEEKSGSQFDPQVAAIFLDNKEKIIQIKEDNKDS